jgi:hypothetical protein
MKEKTGGTLDIASMGWETVLLDGHMRPRSKGRQEVLASWGMCRGRCGTKIRLAEAMVET